MIIIDDKIYGRAEINSPVLCELIESESIQRLRGISQFGLPDEYYYTEGFSRYDHSLGVMLLLKRLGASEEEQVAGLLHDVSHTAFSHLVDWMLGSAADEDFQDSNHCNYITNSDLPPILEKYGYNPEIICDHDRYGLLEQSAPDLCADRIDYALREYPSEVMATCLGALTAHHGQIIFDNQNAARLFADHYLQKQEDHWGGFEAVSRYHIFSKLLQHAIDHNIIDKKDFWQDDYFVINKLTASSDKKILDTLNMLKNKSLDHLPTSNDTTVKKFRYIDPLYLDQNKLTRLSGMDQDYKTKLETARERNRLGVQIVVV